MAFEKAEKDRELAGEQETTEVIEISDEERLKMTEMRGEVESRASEKTRSKSKRRRRR